MFWRNVSLLHTSSSAKRTPPRGALNEAATPTHPMQDASIAQHFSTVKYSKMQNADIVLAAVTVGMSEHAKGDCSGESQVLNNT
eukprot:261937-Amphidinium_carterae.1